MLHFDIIDVSGGTYVKKTTALHECIVSLQVLSRDKFEISVKSVPCVS